jgi:uncharacterized protein (UPF0332 family)
MLARAADKLTVAQLLLDNSAWEDAASRAYYAAFHAISALLFSRGKSYSSHAQLIGAFNRDFVKTQVFKRDFTATLTRLFEDRQSGDYDVSAAISEQEARRDVDDARRIVESIQQYLANESPTGPEAKS